MADIPTEVDTALPREVAAVLHTTEAGLAQMRYRGTGPKFCKVGARRSRRGTARLQARISDADARCP